MATIGIVIDDVHRTVPNSVPIAAESITSSGASQQSTNSIAAGATNQMWILTASGGAVWAKFGADPTAAAGDDHLVPDGATRAFDAVAGQRAAIIDA